jgi:hypothetical protein
VIVFTNVDYEKEKILKRNGPFELVLLPIHLSMLTISVSGLPMLGSQFGC